MLGVFLSILCCNKEYWNWKEKIFLEVNFELCIEVNYVSMVKANYRKVNFRTGRKWQQLLMELAPLTMTFIGNHL